MKKDEEFAESKKLSEILTVRKWLYQFVFVLFNSNLFIENLVKTLDDDEAEFLDDIDRKRFAEELTKKREIDNELSEFRSKVAEIRDASLQTLIKQEIGLTKTDKPKPTFADEDLPSIGATKASQSQRLAGLVKRKSANSESSTECSPQKKSKNGNVLNIKRLICFCFWFIFV